MFQHKTTSHEGGMKCFTTPMCVRDSGETEPFLRRAAFGSLATQVNESGRRIKRRCGDRLECRMGSHT